MRVELNLLYVLVTVFTINGNAASINRSNPFFGLDVGRFSVGKLPEVHFDLPASFAGQVAIPGTLDSSLFFWLVEADHKANRDKLIS